MRTHVYVDGFNLYDRLLQARPRFKWLNPVLLSRNALRSNNEITKLRYFTARISGRLDPTAPGRQQVYLDALASVPQVTVHMGSFLSTTKFAGLVHPPEFKPSPSKDLPLRWPDVVKIHRTEEKGSDVNLACHLLLDAFQDSFDVAAVVSNDSDLTEAIRIATQDLKKVVGLLSPVGNPNAAPSAAASFVRRLNTSHLAASQFPDSLQLPEGTRLEKPSSWS